MKIARITSDGNFIIKNEFIENEESDIYFYSNDRGSIVTPRLNNVKSAMFKIFIDAGQTGWKYILDFRPTFSAYIAVAMFGGFQTVYINNNVVTDTKTLPQGEWIWVYVELPDLKNTAMTVLSNFNTNEPMNGGFKELLVWGRGLTLEEFITFQSDTSISNADLIAHYQLKGYSVEDRLSGTSPTVDKGQYIGEIPFIGLDQNGNFRADEFIEYPTELEGRRNLFSGEFYRDINNYDGVQTYRYHLTNLDSNKRYACRSWLKEGEVAESGFYIVLSIGHPNPNSVGTVGGARLQIISKGNTTNSAIGPIENLPVYISYYPQNTDPSVLDKYYISIQQLDGGNISDWTPAPEDLGLGYSSDIQYFNMGIKDNMLMVTELIEGGV